MSDVAIRVEKLSKRYRIGLREEVNETFVGAIGSLVRSPLQNIRKLRSLSRFEENGLEAEDVIWALKDVSFEVKQGEVLGVIGRNGAGKSTLLKILSRITHPTSGRFELNGRVASLLEVGTGFHQDLTGRENIYLNGTILGMTKAEIDKKFDEIIDFSGVEKFIDTPVKRYSSGMRVRLAFSVAAHLEPEILLVDEVLAVGDAEFQRKCLGKMGDVAKEGRTVLFVSHNMGAINQLCSKSILLRNGILSATGETQDIIKDYLQGNKSEASKESRSKNGHIFEFRIEDSDGNLTTDLGVGECFTVKFKANIPDYVKTLVTGLEISSIDGQKLLNIRSDSQSISFEKPQLSDNLLFIINIPGLPLYPGLYTLDPWFAEYRGERIDQAFNQYKISIHSKGLLQSEGLIQPGRGILLLDCQWACENGGK